ncbi:T9SS type B sorting domain-containing protein, partial [Flavobacteriaceae bacterium]|nr:T9SS type B sorting domain-containing protein [Flavobacteriaceae bacterium]
ILYTLEGCSTFSNSDGELLFYSDGTTVYDKNHDIMYYTNGNPGNNLLGNSSAAQSGMIIPKPLNNDIYYLFTVTDNNSNTGFNVYTIDMSLNGGNGQIIDEDGDGIFFSQLQAGSWSEKVAAVKGQECNTFWVVTAHNNQFFSYKVDENGVNETPEISNVSSSINNRGYLKISPDGTKLVVANQGDSNAVLYDFNNLTGEVSNDETFLAEGFNDNDPYGIEFSVDSKKLYISTVQGFRYTLSEPAVTYKLFQYDLTVTNIPGSQILIHEQTPSDADYPEGGFRGALQLAPNGKIYATIPLAYEDPVSFATHLDVIENPTADGTDVVFTKDALFLDGRTSTQGLPPFISSLLLPIDISDNSGTTINNQDLKYCIGDTISFSVTDPDVISGGSIPEFNWSFNDGTTTTTISTSESLELSNITIANNGIYTLKIDLTNACGDITEYNATFNVEVFEPAIAIQPNNIFSCDTDGDGFIQFDLVAEQNATILSGFDPSIDLTFFEVLYFNDPIDVIDNLNPILTPDNYTNQDAFLEETIYVRVQNTKAPNTCFAITEFKLKVTDLPTPTQPTVYRLCDDTTSAGGDTDGISSFLLNTKDAEILTGVANPGDYTISYHTDLVDAQTSSTTNAIDKDVDYLVTNSQRVYVRVENIANTDCNAISDDSTGSTFNSFELIVDAAPVVVTPPLDINRCDEDRIGFLDFDLITDQTPQILNGLDPSLDTTVFEVLYFDNLSDAELNTTSAIIANPYRVNTSSNPTIYARVHNVNNTTCYSTVDFKLKVTDTPTPTQPTVYRICDDTASGSDTDGISSFLLNTKDAEILTGVTNPGEYTISYHTLLVDAQTSSTANAIDKDTDYPVTNSQRVYVRIENNNDPSQCYTVSDEAASSTFTSFELVVDALPVITDTVELKQCDDDTDGFSFFNLNEAASDISTNYLNETFVFYPSLLDAENDTAAFSEAQALVFENRTVTTDQVWARAISSENCYRIAQVDIIVSTTGLPATFQRSFSVCDDFLDIDGNDTANNDDNDGITSFDFSSVTAEVRALFPVSQQLTITYYRNQADALAELNAIADPSNYRNIGYPVTQQIYIRVDSDLDNDCLGFGPFITLTVEPVTAQEVGPLELCDDLDDGDGFNGIVQTFNLESQTAAILGAQDPLNFTVSYHLSDVDALSGADPILNTSLYENIIPNLQTIYVRVENNLSGCFTAQTSFDLIVNPLPIANFVNDLEVCDDNTDGSAQNGFSQTFDLELQTAGILGTQDPTQFSVTYHASLANAQAGALPLGSPFSNSVPFSQIIYARVYNAATGCVNDISNFNAIVNPEPTTENASNLSYCDDDSDGDDTNGFVQNIDLDSQITDILGTLQDPDDFNVTFHEDPADLIDGTNALSSPYTNTLADQQTIYVRVENKDTGCVNDDFTFEVIVNPLPKFKVTSPQIVCLSGPPLTLFIENPVAVYDYVWTAPNGDESFGEEITIESGGVYTVTATTTNGTDCTRTREILVNESIIATITDDDVTIVDDSDNNSITIDPTNLGIGDYQYALIDENDLQTTFQDIPVFENLTGGFYTIVVQDKNGCRPDATLVVSVIEYPKFFTPNNDGINDTWAIKGANSTFYPSAQINIFNRFGKVVAQIDVDNPGWDGTYGGKILSSDDYWFSIILVDRNGNARERKGNFSLLRR